MLPAAAEPLTESTMNKPASIIVPAPLTIRQVANGYTVEGVPSEYTGVSREETRVFQSFAELQGFLFGHFTHRTSAILPDAPPALPSAD